MEMETFEKKYPLIHKNICMLAWRVLAFWKSELI